MDDIVMSPLSMDTSEIPEVSLTEYMLQRLRKHDTVTASRNWVVDALTGTSIKFNELEELSKRVASALTRLDFKKGDILYCVTYDAAHYYIIQFAVWRLGGALRGCYQADHMDEYRRQLVELRARFVLVDSETASVLRGVVSSLEWSVTLLSVGFDPVPQTIHYSSLIQDDGTAFPDDVQINPKEDVLMIANTSGSTGKPKGALITHYNLVSMVHSLRDRYFPVNQLSLTNTFAVSNAYASLTCLYGGGTAHFLTKFRKEEFFAHLNKYKPTILTIYPYVASWFARAPQLSQHDLTFLKVIAMGGSVLDPATPQILNKMLPEATLFQIYAMSECVGIAYSAVGADLKEKSLKMMENEGQLCISSGNLLTYVKAKIVDPDSGKTLGRGQRGEIIVKAPYVMKGYIVNSDLQQANRSDFDEDGWFHTGDLGFFDDSGCLYVREKISFVFKYYMRFISPSEIEAVLQEHEAVHGAGVVAIPNPETTSLARGFVMLRPGQQVSAAELLEYVASRLPPSKHLHGGITFIDNLPVNRGGKLDRQELLRIALNNEH